VPDAALRESDGRVETVARHSDGRRDAAAARSVVSGDNANDEGGSRRVARSGGSQRLQAFTGRKGLDLSISRSQNLNSAKFALNSGAT
jgi:hypothetical protein